MVKKRELTVEVWNRAMESNREKLLNATEDQQLRFLMHYADEPLGFVSVAFENQMQQLWKLGGMQVYDFDQDFIESILDEKWDVLLPDCINGRPHDSFYLKLPYGDSFEGCIVSVIPADRIDGFQPSWFPGCDEKGFYYGGRKGNERVVVNTGDEILCLCSFAIPKEFEWMTDDTDLSMYPTELVANGVAYLCSANADIVTSYKPQKGLKRNNAKRRSQATWHDVGYRIGSELRSYRRSSSERSEHMGGTVRPHMRRAHWHHYWTGPRNGERKLVLKWLPPTMVGVGNIESATGHKVRRAV